MNVETVGGMTAETCFMSGIKVLQEKIANVIEKLGNNPDAKAAGNDDYVPQSPQGYNSTYGGGGGASAWGGGGGTTPFAGGTTPNENGGTEQDHV